MDRARRFLKSAVKRTALTIAPLALAAATAQAAAVFEANNTNFFFDSGSAWGIYLSSGGLNLQTTNFAAQNNIVGVKGFGTIAIQDYCLECGTQNFSYSAIFSGVAGSGSTPFEVSAVPVSYLFNMASQGANGTFTVTFTINGQSVVDSFSFNSGVLSDGNYQNIINLAVPVTLGGDLVDWSMRLDAVGTLTSGGYMNVDIPSNSLDIGALATTETPEPGTALLLLPGAAFVLYKRRKK